MDVTSVGGKLKRFAGDAATAFNRAVQVYSVLDNIFKRAFINASYFFVCF